MVKRRQYTNVAGLVHDVAPDSEFGAALDQRMERRKIIKELLALRAAQGLSQQDIAGKLECTQSRVSKLENSCDDDMRLGDLRLFAQAVDSDLLVAIAPRNMTTADKVKCHVFAIKKHTDDLVNLAKSDEQIASGVAGFLFELVVNFGRLVGDSVRLLPKGPHGFPYFNFDMEVEAKDCPEDIRADCLLAPSP